MEKRFDILTLGEILIDFTHNGTSSQGNGMFEANPGGAVSNVLAMMNKLGHSAAFMGKVGDDIFGRLLKNTLDELDINTDYMWDSPETEVWIKKVKEMSKEQK